MNVSIIILTYNSASFIEKLLKSIYGFNKALDFEIIVVDNASRDKTVEKVKGVGDKVRIIENDNNYGFARGINIGVKQARGDYLLFINPDTEFERGSILQMIQVFEEERNVGIVGGKLIRRNGGDEKSAGKFLGVFETISMSFGLDEVLGVRFSPKSRKPVDFVSGGFMMVKRDLFQELGGFDENLFMYVEDMDLCFRARGMGYYTYFTPDVVLIHESHGSSNRGFAIKNIYQGLLYFHKKQGSSFSYFLIKSLLLLKASTLVLIGRIINNKYLIKTYSEVFKI